MILLDSLILTSSLKTSEGRFLILTSPSEVIIISWIWRALVRGPSYGRSIKNIGCTYYTGRKWKSCIKSWWWCPHMISQRPCWDIMFEDNSCQIKVWIHSKMDQTSLFCAFIPLPSKKSVKTWRRKKFFANDIMLGHFSNKWLLETGETKTCKLDQCANRSCWDMSLRDFTQKLMEVKPAKSQI